MWRSFYNSFKGKLQGNSALAQAAEQNRIERYFTFPHFEESAERCGRELNKAGLSDVEVEEFPADGSTSWSGWHAMQAWDVEDAQLMIVSPSRKVLSRWSVKPEGLVMYSGPGVYEGSLVEWNGESDAELKDKIPLTNLRPLDVIHQMRAKSIPGIVSDFIGTLPGVRDRFDLPDDVRWENYAFKKYPGEHWGFMITPRQGKLLRDMLKKGPVKLRAEIKSQTYNGIMKSATGVIRGTDPGKGDVLITTHLYEPGANDNASGAGLALEIARSLNACIEEGIVPRPRRNIRFLFNWEGFGLLAWAHSHRDRISSILGGVNIDELGVDQSQGQSILHLFMPPAANNSCIGYLLAHLCEELLTPTLRWKAVADRAEIINDAITADPHIDIVLPTLIQYPSRHYHASSDRIETLSADTLELLGELCATHLYFLANAGNREAGYLARIVTRAFHNKLHSLELRLMEGSWFFDLKRTRTWLREFFTGSIPSLKTCGLGNPEAKALEEEFETLLDTWCSRWKDLFQSEIPRKVSSKDMKRASSMILERTTLGAPMPPEIQLSPEESRIFFNTLYEHNLDLVFLRLFYWADGTRSLMEIIERLEIELDELYRDSSIARTGTGLLIDSRVPLEIDMRAILSVTDVIVQSGYLKSPAQ